MNCKTMGTLAVTLGMMGALVAHAEKAELAWKFEKGRVVREMVTLAEEEDTYVWRISAADLRARGAKELRVTPAFGRARVGEKGYWFNPYGYYGEYTHTNGVFDLDAFSGGRMNMPMYGWSTPRGAYLAIITSLKLYPRLCVNVKDGAYALSCCLNEEHCREPYEDFEIVFHRFPAGTPYAALCARYRDYQLARKAVRPLAERVKGNKYLKYAVEAPEVRIRQAWKPVPSLVPFQTPENEPPLKKVAVTFDRVGDIVRESQKQSLACAEFCLVGWNIGGHDGRWPQSFPAEPQLGGDAKMRALVAQTQKAGYQIVPHGNFIDGYVLSDSFDAEWLVKDRTGSVDNQKMYWGGGRPFMICPQRAYEKFCFKDMPRMAAFGFRGLGYFDVVSIVFAPVCYDPRHPCTRKDSARYWGMCADIARREFGGFASEGAIDHFAGSLDSVLYACFTDPVHFRSVKGFQLVSRIAPIFQLVYNGIIVSNPFTKTVNFTAQEKYFQLKLLEFGGRPNFYFYSKFLTDTKGDWMGKSDLGCATDAELAWSVGKIKAGCDVYLKVRDLQYQYMTGHDVLSADLVRTTWADGTRMYFNYGKKDVTHDGVAVPATSAVRVTNGKAEVLL